MLTVLLAWTAHAQGFTYYNIRTDPAMAEVQYGSVALADYNGDGYHDFFVTGGRWEGRGATRLYSFREYVIIETPYGDDVVLEFHPDQLLTTEFGWYSASAWADVDLDGDLDVVLSGADTEAPPYEASSRLYYNNGDGTFSPANATMPGLVSGSVTWADYDNDGDPDLLLTGATGPEGQEPFTALYDNDAGRLSASTINLPQLAFSTAAWADVDLDGDLDVVLSGLDTDDQPFASLFHNDSGTFTPSGSSLPGLLFPTAAWGDYDDDGDPDLLLTGARPGPALYHGSATVYDNEGGHLAVSTIDLANAFLGGGAWGDFDNDGLLDLVLMGQATPASVAKVGRFYQNTGAAFTTVTNVPGIFAGDVAWGDIDGDGDLDVLLSGERSDGLNSVFYRNESTRVNDRPSAPSNLHAEASAGAVTLSWEAATDPETASPGLTYNLRVGTTPGGSDVMPPAALASGRRLLPACGNAGQNTSWSLQDLSEGTYFWSVQALDHSFIGSRFAGEGTFTVTDSGKRSTSSTNAGSLPDRTALHPAYPNPFARSTAFRFDLPSAAPATLRIYDVLGRAVRTLTSGTFPAGTTTLRWDGADQDGHALAPGVYVARLDAAGYTHVQTVVLTN